MKIPKSFVKPIETQQQLPTLLEALHILHKFSFYHNKAITEHGSNNYTMASYWYNKAQTFLNNHLIQQSMIQETQPKYSVHNATHNTFLVPNPNGLQGNYIFSLEKEKSKSSFWLAHNNNRIARSKDYKILEEHYSELKENIFRYLFNG